MVYLRNLFARASLWTSIAMLVVVLDLTLDVDAGTMKIAYKKGILGKPNVVKEKRYNIRSGVIREVPTNTSDSSPSLITSTAGPSTTPPSPLQVSSPKEQPSITAPMTAEVGQPELHELVAGYKSPTVEVDATINPQDIEKLLEDKQLVGEDDALRQYLDLNKLMDGAPQTPDALPHIKPLVNNTLEEEAHELLLGELMTQATAPQHVKVEGEGDEIEELFPLPEPEALIAPRRAVSSTKTSSKNAIKATTTTTESNLPVPCTCGVFLTSQLKRGGQPQGSPVITNELDRTFACNSVGQKQCQTKCLETLVQHLPNSATILCASLNRDCRKERAYLFIKNCRNHWVNTNLAAGREYCCRNNKPYNCPLV